MLEVKIMMNEAIIVSDYTTEDLKTVQKYKPEVLKLYDENGDVDFVYKCDGENGVFSHGIAFGKTTSDGKAATKVVVCGETEAEKKRYFAERYTYVMINANAVEEGIEQALSVIKEEIDSVEQSVSVLL
ncbi:hypothetical protein M2140_000089 [Clostridiales Family XIII bacterium PM5-7]